MARWPPCLNLMIVIRKLTHDSLMPNVDFLKIDGASAGVNEKLKASIGTVKLAASAHTTANNNFKNVNLVSGTWLLLKDMTTAVV